MSIHHACHHACRHTAILGSVVRGRVRRVQRRRYLNKGRHASRDAIFYSVATTQPTVNYEGGNVLAVLNVC